MQNSSASGGSGIIASLNWSRSSNIKNLKATKSLYLTVIFIVLLSLGAANLYSASSEGSSYFNMQLKNTALSIIAFAVVGWGIPIKHVKTYATPAYILLIIALLIVLILGHTAGGSQRWMSLGPIRFQPSEIAKIAIAITVAKWFYVHKLPHPYRLRDLWSVIAQAGLVFGLIFLQPDLGTAGICLIIAAAQTLFMRLNKKSVAIVFFSSLISGVVGWNFFLHSYQKLRILNLLNPSLDPSGSGYNSLQSLVAVGSGSIFGKGYLLGSQTQLQFLPARHTDFIFSVFAEEHGFVGGVFVFLLFGILAFIALEIAKQARDSFCALLAVGLTTLIFIEFVINVAMVLGMFPVVGMPLPFLSYGGSSLLTVSIAMGLLVGIDRDNVGANQKSKPLSRPSLA